VVDGFATVAMLRLENDSKGVIYAGSYLNQAISGDVDYLGAHSVGPARLANLICWAAGGDESLLDTPTLSVLANGIQQQGSRDCIGEYNQQLTATQQLLNDHLKTAFADLPQVDRTDRGDCMVEIGDSQVSPALAQALRDGNVAGELAQSLNAFLNLPRDITIAFEDCGEINAFYDPTRVRVSMCYEFVQDVAQFFNFDDDRTFGALGFVFYHELGHALVDQFSLPVLGREEDVVDGFAAAIMVQVEEDARGMVHAASHLNGAGEAVNPIEFVGSHTVGPARVANLLCWATGGDSSLLQDADLNAAVQAITQLGERDCQDEYRQRVNATQALLQPQLKQPLFTPPAMEMAQQQQQ